jgi:superfamily II DNA or RNA helicase
MESLGIPTPGEPIATWRAWAKTRFVQDVLDAPANLLREGSTPVERDFFWGGIQEFPTLGAVLTFQPAQPSWGSPPASLQHRAVEFLHTRAAELAVGLAEEPMLAATLAREPADPELAALCARLRHALQSLRKRLAPRPQSISEGARLELRVDPVRITYQEVQDIWCSRGHAPVLEIALEPTDVPGVTLTCPCQVTPEAPCGLALSGVQTLLLTLLGADPSRLGPRILTELRRPWWTRALADLRALTPETPDVAGELGWRLAVWSYALARLEPVLVQAKKTSGGVKLRKLKLADVRSLPPEALLPIDREVLALLQPDASSTPSVDRPRILVTQALARLATHPRLYFGTASLPMTVVQEDTSLAVEPADRGAVVLQVRVGSQTLTLAEFLTWYHGHHVGDGAVEVDAPTGRVRLVQIDARLLATVQTLARRPDRFPAEAVTALLDHLTQAPLPLVLPAELRGESREPVTDTLVRLDALAGVSLLLRAEVRPLPGARTFPPGHGPAEVSAHVAGRRVWLRRDLARETHDAQERLLALGLSPAEETARWTWTLDGERAIDVLAALALDPPGVVVEWADPGKRRVVHTLRGQDLRIALIERQDWFAVQGGADLDGQQIPIAELIAALRSGKRYVRAEGDVLVRMADDLRHALQPLADLAQEHRTGLQLSPLHAGLLPDLSHLGLQAPPRWHDLATRIHAAQTLDPPVPPGLRATLRDYQREGFRWLVRLASWSTGACLADDMGLGKTVQTLALLLHRADLGPALVVAPLSVTFNWLREAEQFAPDLRLRPLQSLAEGELAALGPGDVVVAGYDRMLRHAPALAERQFATLVLDEAQAVKNASTRRAQAVHALQADFRLALTGTPVENRVGELWSLFRTIAPGLLGSWEQFRDRFGTPIERHSDPGARQALARIVRGFVLRRLKRDVAAELPERTEMTLDVVLSPEEQRLYDTFRAAAVAQLSGVLGNTGTQEQRRFQVLAALTRLRQLACHPRLVDPDSAVPSSKLAALLERVQELHAEGHRALIFSQFTKHLALVKAALTEAGLTFRTLDGDTPEVQRRVEVDAFQRGEGDVFLLSLKAGGTGLNLTAADYVLHLDPWWNPAVEDQATDRAHRIGQTRPVTVYRLVARGTVEEAILKLHGHKRDLVAGLLDGTGTAAAVTTEELLGLLAGNGTR